MPFWDDTKIPPGVVWLDVLRNAIDCSALIICLLSAKYFSSKFIRDVELGLICEANARGAPLIPIYVAPFSLHPDHWLSQLQGANSPERTLIAMNEVERETLYSEVAELLRTALAEKVRTPSQPTEDFVEEAPQMSALTKVQEARTVESARYNIAVVGRTGVGKSELINYLFGKQVAKSGIGRPVTKRGFTRQNFELKGIPGTLFDSWGLEVDKSNEWIADLRDEMRRRGTDRPTEEWFHTIFFCIDACSTRIQDFESAIVKQFFDEKYCVVVIFTKSDLASRRTVEKLQAIVKQEIGTAVPSIPVCSTSEELAVGRTMPFGATDVIRQIYEGFWLSIIQRLPARCVTLMCREIDKWRESMVHYVEDETGIFNHQEIVAYVDGETSKFVKSMRDHQLVEIVEQEARQTIAVFGKFERLLNYAAYSTHDIKIQVDPSLDLSPENKWFLLAKGVASSLPVSHMIIAAAVSSLTGLGAIGTILTGGLLFPILAGAVYVTGETNKTNFKRTITTKINELAELVKRELKTSEPQIEAGLRKMLSSKRASAIR